MVGEKDPYYPHFYGTDMKMRIFYLIIPVLAILFLVVYCYIGNGFIFYL